MNEYRTVNLEIKNLEKEKGKQVSKLTKLHNYYLWCIKSGSDFPEG